MKRIYNSPKSIEALSLRVGMALGLLLAFTCVAVGSASAAYQQVGTFGGSLVAPVEPGMFPEEVQLGGVGGLAVNVNGAGGVTAGTVYAATESFLTGVYVVQFEPEPGGKLKFVQRWQVRPVEGEYELCGPARHTTCSTQVFAIPGRLGVDVDQTTGNVYVYRPREAKELNVVVYGPDGSEVITRFGEQALPSETIASTPEKIHSSTSPGGIAVDDSGSVYLFDADRAAQGQARLMVFRPQTSGDYKHYVYAGESNDIGTTSISGEQSAPAQPVVDSHGDVYTASGGQILEFNPSQSSAPVCRFDLAKEGIRGMTVNPVSGEVFYYDFKGREIHQLQACNAEGKFMEVEGASFGLIPQRGYIDAMAFNPSLQYDPDRPVGVLYAATPEAAPEIGGGGEPSLGALGYIVAPPASHEPVVESVTVSRVLGTSAVLGAQINPKGANTRYSFQYLTAAAYEGNEPSERFAGASEAPVGGAPVGSGSSTVAVSAAVSGLTPGTEYRYRVIAISAEGRAEAVAPSVFRTFPVEAAGLPDGRAYELVSPVDKHGGEVFPANPGIRSCRECKPGITAEHFPMQSAADGEAVAYEGSGFSSEGAAKENEYISRRTSSGWQTTALSPVQQQSGAGQGFKVFDAELTHDLIYQRRPSLTPDAPAEYSNLYSQPTAAPLELSPLLTSAPPNRPPGTSFVVAYAGASADLSRVFFEANDALTGETPFAPAAVDGGESTKNLYEWAGGELRLVNVAPGNGSTAAGAGFGARSASEYVRNDLSHAVSNDGSRVFWTSEAGQVYVREDGERTVEIPDHTAGFVSAAADGSKVLLSDGRVYGELGADVPVAEADLTDGKGGFQGMVGQSEDLSRIYFVDTAVLDETPNAEGVVAQSGQDNLYAWHDGTSLFIATLLKQDNVNDESLGDWIGSPTQRTAEASPDGQWVAFLSQALLTGYDNTGPCETDHKGGFVDAPCEEAFLYDTAAGRLICISCDPSGAPPLGPSHLPTILPNGNGSLAQPSYLSDSGRVVFDSEDSLSPRDANNGVEDVYEYEPEGIGSCAREAGCVSLISGGSGPGDSNFLAMDPSGKNIFFTTRDQLSGRDRDQLLDVYDAREGGGIAAESAVPPRECLGDECQAPPSSASIEPSPGSLAFSGAGNILAPVPPTAATVLKPKALTRAQELANALKACKGKSKKRRAVCEQTARRKYGAKAKAKRADNHRKEVR